MIGSRSAFLCLVAITAAAHAKEPAPQDFAYAKRIETPGKAAMYRVALPADVYRHVVRADLGDLRVFNARGEVVPHSLTRPRGELTLRLPARRMPLFPLKGDPKDALDKVRVTIESGQGAVNVQTQSAQRAPEPILSYVVDGRELKMLVAAMQLEWPADAAEFAGRLKIEASDDLGGWRTVTAAAPVANLHSDGRRIVERQVEFRATQAKFWRLSWVGAAPSFTLTGVNAEPAAGRIDARRSELIVSGKPVAGRPGEVAFDLGARLPVDRVNFELAEQNSIVQIGLQSRANLKDPWLRLGEYGFYRLETRNGEMRNGAIAVAANPHRYWLANIDQNGGLGSGAPQLKAGWIAHEVVFVARGSGPFQLAYGSGSAGRSEAVLGVIPQDVPIVQASLGAEHQLGGVARLRPPEPPFPWKSALLWTVLALGVLLLAWMAYRLTRQL